MLNFGIIDPVRFRAFAGAELEARYGPRLEHAVHVGWPHEEGGVYGVEPGRFRELPWIRALFYFRAGRQPVFASRSARI